MPSSKYSFGWPLSALRGTANFLKSNAWSRKNFEQFPQIDHQRQSVFVAQHASAMRDILRSLLQQILRCHRIRADHFVRSDPNPQIVMHTVAGQGSNDHMLWQQTRSPPFGNSDIDERHDRSAQIENSRPDTQDQAAAWSKAASPALLQRPAPADKTVLARCGKRNTAIPAAALPCGPRASSRSLCVRGKRCQVKFFAHCRISSNHPQTIAYANRRTARINSSLVNGFVTYPSAPCCAPQYLSLWVFFDVTKITGIALNFVLLLQFPANLKSISLGITTSSKITLGRSMAIVSSTRFGSLIPTPVAFGLEQALNQPHLRR